MSGPDVDLILNALSEFYTPADSRLWLESPQRLLGGETPIDLIDAGRIDEVLAVIDQLQSGAFV